VGMCLWRQKCSDDGNPNFFWLTFFDMKRNCWSPSTVVRVKGLLRFSVRRVAPHPSVFSESQSSAKRRCLWLIMMGDSNSATSTGTGGTGGNCMDLNCRSELSVPIIDDG